MPSVKGLSRQLWIYNVHHATRFLPLSLSLSTINIGVSTWTWFFFSLDLLFSRIDTFFFPLSLLCCRGAVPKRRFARSGRLPVRPPSQSDEMLGISQVSRRTRKVEKTRQRESIDLHVRHSVTLSIVEAWFTGVPGSMSCAILSGKSRYLWVNEFSWIFLNFSFFFNSFATILILSSVDVDIDISQMIISMMKF